MPIDYVLTRSVRTPGGLITTARTRTAGAQAVIDEVIGSPITNQLMPIAFNFADIKAVYMVCDVACTIKTNSSGAPDDTITLAAGEELSWDVNDAAIFDNLFAANVTKFYVTMAAGTLKVYVLHDPTH